MSGSVEELLVLAKDFLALCREALQDTSPYIRIFALVCAIGLVALVAIVIVAGNSSSELDVVAILVVVFVVAGVAMIAMRRTDEWGRARTLEYNIERVHLQLSDSTMTHATGRDPR